jgi:hypothetical protein
MSGLESNATLKLSMSYSAVVASMQNADAAVSRCICYHFIIYEQIFEEIEKDPTTKDPKTKIQNSYFRIIPVLLDIRR